MTIREVSRTGYYHYLSHASVTLKTALTALGIVFKPNASPLELNHLLQRARTVSPVLLPSISTLPSLLQYCSVADGSMICYLEDNHSIGIWNLNSQVLIRVLSTGTLPENCRKKFVTNADNTIIVAPTTEESGSPCLLGIWNASGERLGTIDFNPFSDFLIVENSLLIITASSDFQVYDFSGHLTESFKIHRMNETPLFSGISPNKNFISIYDGATLFLIDRANRRATPYYCPPSSHKMHIANDGTIIIHTNISIKLILDFSIIAENVDHFDTSPDKKQLVVSTKDGSVEIYDLVSFEKRTLVKPDHATKYRCIFSSSGKFIIGFHKETDGNSKCIIWDLEQNRSFERGISNVGDLQQCTSTPCGKVITLAKNASGQGCLHIWDHLPV